MKLTKSEKAGVEAIIYLQSMAGITETKKKAIAGWQGMSANEQQSTMKVFVLMNPKGKAKK